MPDVAMPRLSDSMEEGTILKWLRGEGEAVSPGDELVEIETDKANMTYEAEQGGVLSIVAREGETLPVGAVIARLGESAGTEAAAEPETKSAPAAEPGPEPEPADEPEPAEEPEPAPAAARAPDPAADGEGPRASPVARRMARELGVALEDLVGTGPGGRVTRRDVAAAAGEGADEPGPPAATPVAPSATPAAPAATPSAPAAPAAAPRPGTAKGEVTHQELTRLQQTVARRMAESKATAPEFVLQVDAAMDAAAALREQLKGAGGPPPSFNDFVIKAAAMALRELPRANGAYRDGRFELYSRVNVGMAVAASDALVVPTVFDADTKPLLKIAEETRALAERVRAGVVTPPELSGGTFTVSNLGMYGMGRIVPVINPPQAAILGVGAIEERPVAREGAVEIRKLMSLTLVCDHRILYGAEAATFLARIRELLERPLGLAVA